MFRRAARAARAHAGALGFGMAGAAVVAATKPAQDSGDDADVAYLQQKRVPAAMERALRSLLHDRPPCALAHLGDSLTAAAFGADGSEPGSGFATMMLRAHAFATLYPTHPLSRALDSKYIASLSPGAKVALLRVLSSVLDAPSASSPVLAVSPSDYDTLPGFLGPLSAAASGVPADVRHSPDWDVQGRDGLNTDALGLPAAAQLRVRVARNLPDAPLPAGMRRADRIAAEQRLAAALQAVGAKDAEFQGAYYSSTAGSPNFAPDKVAALQASGAMFSRGDDGPLSADWPCGRGCWVSADGKLVAWVGEEDHLRVIASQSGGNVADVFSRARRFTDAVETALGTQFAKSPSLGYVTSSPAEVGSGVRASARLGGCVGTPEAQAAARGKGLLVREADGAVTVTAPAARGVTEGATAKNLFESVKAYASAAAAEAPKPAAAAPAPASGH